MRGMDISGGINFTTSRRRARGAGIIPLVDVAFFLLIFFMVAGSIEQFEIIEITTPQAASGEMLDEGHLVILLGRHEEIVMEDQLLDMAQMKQMLGEILALHPDKVITIKADASVPAVRVIAVMDAVQMAGGRNITIATEGSEAAENAP